MPEGQTANSLIQEGLGVEPHCTRSRRASSAKAVSVDYDNSERRKVLGMGDMRREEDADELELDAARPRLWILHTC